MKIATGKHGKDITQQHFHISVQEKIEILNEKLELATGGEKFPDGQDTSDTGASWKHGTKKCRFFVTIHVCLCYHGYPMVHQIVETSSFRI